MSKVLFITGCNGQIGSQVCELFAEKNWTIFGMDLEKSSSLKFLKKYFTGSVSVREDLFNFFKLAKTEINKESQICLINNAGVSVFTPSEERTYEEFLFVSEVNLLGPIYSSTELYKFVRNLDKDLLEKIDSHIINISSVYGIISPNNSIYTDTKRNNSEIYGATKAGLIQLTKYFAARYAHQKIRVNCIAPGGVLNEALQGEEFIRNYSKLVPMKRLCDSREVSQLCYLLASNKIGYLTGQTISLDGGMTSW